MDARPGGAPGARPGRPHRAGPTVAGPDAAVPGPEDMATGSRTPPPPAAPGAGPECGTPPAPRSTRTPARPTLAVWKLASCDGCQLTLLDCEDELLALAGQVEIAHFREATSAEAPGPYDLSLVEGSVSTPEGAERIRHIRAVSRRLVTIGACATAGGVQALRNFADSEEFRAAVYARPEYIATLATSTPVSAHVPVDFELRGCPIDRRQLLEVITAFLAGRRPNVPGHCVCFECKQRGNVCVTVAHGTPCLGPVTHAGCGALCPTYDRGCYGCFGPVARPNLPAMIPLLRHDGMAERDVLRVFRTFNAASPEYADVPVLARTVRAGPAPRVGGTRGPHRPGPAAGPAAPRPDARRSDPDHPDPAVRDRPRDPSGADRQGGEPQDPSGDEPEKGTAR